MKLKLEMNLDNDAFWIEDDEDELDYDAIGDALADVAEKMENGLSRGSIWDVNGNKVGKWEIV